MNNYAQGIGSEFPRVFDGEFPTDVFEGRGRGDRSRSADEAQEVESNE